MPKSCDPKPTPLLAPKKSKRVHKIKPREKKNRLEKALDLQIDFFLVSLRGWVAKLRKVGRTSREEINLGDMTELFGGKEELWFLGEDGEIMKGVLSVFLGGLVKKAGRLDELVNDSRLAKTALSLFRLEGSVTDIITDALKTAASSRAYRGSTLNAPYVTMAAAMTIFHHCDNDADKALRALILAEEEAWRLHRGYDLTEKLNFIRDTRRHLREFVSATMGKVYLPSTSMKAFILARLSETTDLFSERDSEALSEYLYEFDNAGEFAGKVREAAGAKTPFPTVELDGTPIEIGVAYKGASWTKYHEDHANGFYNFAM